MAASSSAKGTARATEGATGTPGNAADLPSKGGIMNTTPPSTTGGKPYVSTSKYAASPRCTEGD